MKNKENRRTRRIGRRRLTGGIRRIGRRRWIGKIRWIGR